MAVATVSLGLRQRLKFSMRHLIVLMLVVIRTCSRLSRRERQPGRGRPSFGCHDQVNETLRGAALAFAGGTLSVEQPAFAQGSATVGSLRGVIRDKATGRGRCRRDGRRDLARAAGRAGRHHRGERPVLHHVAAAGPLHADRLLQRRHVLARQRADPGRQGSRRQRHGRLAAPRAASRRARSSRSRARRRSSTRARPRPASRSPTTTRATSRPAARSAPSSARRPVRRPTTSASRSPARRRSRTCTSSKASTRRTPGFGGLSSNLPNEFIQETEVITGGYNAEFGRATGGIVNVVTKQGSNEFHGSVFGYFQPGALIANAKAIQREGGSIDSQTDLDYRYDIGAELGGPIIKDKLWFHVGFNPSFAHDDDHAPASRRQVDDEPATASRCRSGRPASRSTSWSSSVADPARLQDVLLHRQDQRRDQPEQPVPDLGVR